MNADHSAYGLWILVVLNSAVFIFFAFSFIKPRSKTDWRSLGAFSAFVVALFVEMYGSPLTIYFLAGWLASRFPDLDPFSHESGHLLQTLLGVEGDPHFNVLHIASSIIIVVGFLILASSWRVLHQAQQHGELAMTGWYARCRHPQYAASIVREKEVGTIEQLMVTPIRRGELFIAKTVPTLLIGLIALFPSLALVGWFGVPVRGSLPLFFALTALFLLSAIGLGVLVAAISRTLQQALLLAFFGLFPLMFLSGTMVPVENMPNLLQQLSLASPLRHYLDITLGIFLKGAGMEILWPHALALVAIGMPLYLVAWLIFRRVM